jgi:hypothetical protein
LAIDPYSLTTLANLKSYLGISVSTDDTILERCIDRASAAIESYTARQFLSRRYYEIRDCYGANRLALKQYPVSLMRFVGAGWTNVMSIVSTNSTDSFASVSVDSDHVHLYRVSSTGAASSTSITFASHDVTSELAAQISATTGFSATALINVPTVYLRKLAGRDLRTATAYLEAPTQSLGNYQVDLDNGVIYGPGIQAYRSILIDYTAGYDTIPYDIEQACLMLSARFYRSGKRDPTLQSESLGGYSYSVRSTGDFDDDLKAMIAGWRRFR